MDTEVPGQVTGSEVHSSPVSRPTLPATDHHQVDTDQHQNRTAEKHRSAENDWHAERARERDWGGGGGTSVHPHEKGQEPHDEDRLCLVRDPLFSSVVYVPISVVEKQLTIWYCIQVNNPLDKFPFSSPSLHRMIGLPAGIIGFILTKREVDKNRLKQLRIRQRMNRSNEGEYEGSRYRNNRLDWSQLHWEDVCVCVLEWMCMSAACVCVHCLCYRWTDEALKRDWCIQIENSCWETPVLLCSVFTPTRMYMNQL